MPTTIDIENAKQIRQPMDVEISVALADTGAALTYSGYTSTAKVADGVLGQRTWPMRVLADLQKDGFPLDGTCSLYDSTISPSAANGKLGVRGNVGQDVGVTISRSTTIPAALVTASGASYVTYGGTQYSLANGRASVLIGASTATLTFTPVDGDTRAEVNYIGSEIEFTIRNDTLIKAELFLRSDLGISGELSLPESELTVEAFVATDVSEYVASVPEDTPITYRAGYDSDLSDERRFYVSERVEWKDNILTVHAVDAVHFLDYELPTAVECGYFSSFYGMFITFASQLVPGVTTSVLNGHVNRSSSLVIDKGKTIREIAASLNTLFHQPGRNGHLDLWPTYVDAGIPRLTSTKPSVKWDVYEEDCENVKKTIDRKVNAFTGVSSIPFGDSINSFQKVGSAQIVKNVGVTINVDDCAETCAIGLARTSVGGNGDFEKVAAYLGGNVGLIQNKILSLVPTDTRGTNGIAESVAITISGGTYPRKLLSSNIPQDDYKRYPVPSSTTSFSQFIPWNCYYDTSEWRQEINSMQKVWNVLLASGVVSEETDCTLDLFGRIYQFQDVRVTFKNDSLGIEKEMPENGMRGEFYVRAQAETYYERVYPDGAYLSLLEKDNITGSFTWKGDPRMQPRDVVTFHRLDGTDEVITLENITLTHEGGGTKAEITYRKGIV